MRTLELGRTGLTVSEIGFGLAAIGRPGYITLGRARDLGPERDVATMRARAHRLLDAAYAAGIRYFDAARSYGRAEEFLASWLDARGFGRADVTVGSKWGYRYTADWQVGAAVNEVKDHSAGHLRKQIGESRALLGERLGLYQIHSATLESGVLDDAAVLDELARLRDGGLRIGLSVSGPRQADAIHKALEIRRGGTLLFASVQATWNLLEPSAGAALADAHGAGLGIIVKEALGNGRLVNRPDEPRPDARPPQVVMDVAARLHATTDAVALAAALAQPWRHVALSGAVTPAQVEANAAAADLHLDGADLEALAAAAEPADRYWATRAALAWT